MPCSGVEGDILMSSCRGLGTSLEDTTSSPGCIDELDVLDRWRSRDEERREIDVG